MGSETPTIMASVSQLAERDGISKQAVSKRIRNILDSWPDTPVERDRNGRIAAISEADYDLRCEGMLNPAKSETGGGEAKGEQSFNEARRRAEWLKVRRAELEMQEQARDLLRADMVKAALDEAGRVIMAAFMRFQNRADDLAIAVSKEGVHGLRVALRKAGEEEGNRAADDLAKIAAAAPAHDPQLEPDEA